MKILLIYGGEGSEHEVSLMSAKNVTQALHDAGIETEHCLINKTGEWEISFDHLRKADYDAIFPLVHGKGGEDGGIAALGDLFHIPVVGCGVAASVLAWDKDLCKQMFSDADIPVVPWRTFGTGEVVDYNKVTHDLGSEILFVKPAREGSSVGISKAANVDEFNAAIKEAFEYDSKIIIELAIKGRELECAVLGNAPDVQATDVGEIKPPENDFYSYEEKYSEDSHTDCIIPAKNLPDQVRIQIQNYAKKAFTTIGGRGLSRIDFFYDEMANQIYLNEVNTMPGFTNISMYPKLWERAGITYPQLLARLVEFAIDAG